MFTNKQLIALYGAGAVALIIIALGALAWQRGALTVSGGVPHFSPAAFLHPMPSLDRPINFPDTFNDVAKTIYEQQLARNTSALKADPNNTSAWMDRAIAYRQVDDFAGAAEIWQYLLAKNPKQSIVLHNLGEYYFHTVKDYKAAETYYMRSISLSPDIEQNYLDLYDMYHDVYKQDTTAAPDILKQGISAVPAPGNITFLVILGQYYQQKGDTVNARSYYEQALEKLGNKSEYADQIHQIKLLQSTLK